MLYDIGTGLEVLSPLCPQLFLEMAGLGNFAKVHIFIEFLKSIYMVAFVNIQVDKILVHSHSCLCLSG